MTTGTVTEKQVLDELRGLEPGRWLPETCCSQNWWGCGPTGTTSATAYRSPANSASKQSIAGGPPMILVDTDVMVDVMRRHTPAVAWLDSLGTETIGIPGLVAMELLQGCRDREEQRRVENVLRP
jgi:hypothetical protein